MRDTEMSRFEARRRIAAQDYTIGPHARVHFREQGIKSPHDFIAIAAKKGAIKMIAGDDRTVVVITAGNQPSVRIVATHHPVVEGWLHVVSVQVMSLATERVNFADERDAWDEFDEAFGEVAA